MLFAVSRDCYLGAPSVKSFVAVTTLICFAACCGCGAPANPVAKAPPAPQNPATSLDKPNEPEATVAPGPGSRLGFGPGAAPAAGAVLPKSRKFVFHYKF